MCIRCSQQLSAQGDVFMLVQANFTHKLAIKENASFGPKWAVCNMKAFPPQAFSEITIR